MNSFEALGVSADLVARLSADGIDAPFPIQALTIPDALAGRDLCGKAKTGSGKTLAFGLPLLERAGKAEPRRPTGLVLVPTRELANQVFGVLEPLGRLPRPRGVRGVRRRRASSPRSRRSRRGVDIVVGTPGRLIDLMQRGDVSFDGVEVLVLDEADRMADMGFMPQVQKILFTMTSAAPDDALLGHARRRGQAPRRPLHATTPCTTRSPPTSRPSTRWSTGSSTSTSSTG